MVKSDAPKMKNNRSKKKAKQNKKPCSVSSVVEERV